MARIFDVPRELAFHAWTDPVQRARWWQRSAEMVGRDGSGTLIALRETRHAVDATLDGVFERVEPNERLESIVDCAATTEAGPIPARQTVTFEEFTGRTRVTVGMRFESKEVRDAMVRAGLDDEWNQRLDRLSEHLDLVVSRAGAFGRAANEVREARVVDAPRESVFRAWTDPKRIARWWGAQGTQTSTHAIDVRSGGEWRYVVHEANGGTREERIAYVEVVEPERIVYRRVGEPGRESEATDVTVTFEDLGKVTRVTARTSSRARSDGTPTNQDGAASVSETLDRMTAYVEAL